MGVNQKQHCKCIAKHNIVQKSGQVTKPIIVVKMPCKLLYVIQVKCLTSLPYLISKILVAYNHAFTILLQIGIGLFTARLFCLGYHFFCK